MVWYCNCLTPVNLYIQRNILFNHIGNIYLRNIIEIMKDSAISSRIDNIIDAVLCCPGTQHFRHSFLITLTYFLSLHSHSIASMAVDSPVRVLVRWYQAAINCPAVVWDACWDLSDCITSTEQECLYPANERSNCVSLPAMIRPLIKVRINFIRCIR